MIKNKTPDWKMLRGKRSCIKVLILCFLLLCSLMLSVSAAFKNPPIVDEAEYLMQSESIAISKKLSRIRAKYDFDVAIYTETEQTGDTAEASADEIYDSRGYGTGENADGILLYICAETGEYHFTAHGKGLGIFNSNGLAYIERKVVPHLSENDYYEAFRAYIDTSGELLEMAKSSTSYNKKQYSGKYIYGVIIAALFILLLIAFLLRKLLIKSS